MPWNGRSFSRQAELIGPEVLPEAPVEEEPQVVAPQSLASPASRVSNSESAAGASPVSPQSPKDGHWLTAAEVECEHIRLTLEHTGYNQSAAARLLGIDRHLLRRRIVEHGLDVSRSRQGRPALRISSRRHAA